MAIRVCKGKYNISKDDKIDYTFLEVDDNIIFIRIKKYVISLLILKIYIRMGKTF